MMMTSKMNAMVSNVSSLIYKRKLVRLVGIVCFLSILAISYSDAISSMLQQRKLEQENYNFYHHSNNDEKDRKHHQPGISIFYNAYVPRTDDPQDIEGAFSIIKEQMEQVSKSAAAADRSKMTFRYVTIGESFNVMYIQELCTFYKLHCVHVQHHDAAQEMATQQVLLDFCSEEGNEMEIVSYIHDKGSFNPSERQNQIRGRLTKAALRHECVHSLSNNQCNVCGANFKATWGPTYWANMWSARCDYVKKLVSPYDLYSKNKEAFESRPKDMTTDLYGSEGALTYALGKGRYASEQFVANHPSLIPCSYDKPENPPNAFWIADPPRDFYDEYVIHGENPLSKDELEVHDNKREWYLLPGILWRYHKLYNEMPPPDSWIWRFYPDGEYWRESIALVGFPEALLEKKSLEK